MLDSCDQEEAEIAGGNARGRHTPRHSQPRQWNELLQPRKGCGLLRSSGSGDARYGAAGGPNSEPLGARTEAHLL
jgi:hypothetical protein